MSANTNTVMGKITSVYGVKGWVKVFSYTQPKENLAKYKVWALHRDGVRKQIKVLQCKVHGNGMVAHLEGCNDRDQAKQLAGFLIKVDVSELPDLEENEFYWHQLEGLHVKSVDGQLLGRVHQMMETGSNDVVVVRKCAGSIDAKERLIPYLPDQVIVSIDLELGEMVVDWDIEF